MTSSTEIQNSESNSTSSGRSIPKAMHWASTSGRSPAITARRRSRSRSLAAAWRRVASSVRLQELMHRVQSSSASRCVRSPATRSATVERVWNGRGNRRYRSVRAFSSSIPDRGRSVARSDPTAYLEQRRRGDVATDGRPLKSRFAWLRSEYRSWTDNRSTRNPAALSCYANPSLSA